MGALSGFGVWEGHCEEFGVYLGRALTVHWDGLFEQPK